MAIELTAREKAERILSGCSEDVKDALYRSVWYDHVRLDIRSYEKDMDLDKPLTDDQVDYAAERYVYDGEYDCTVSYWGNIEGVINMALEFA